MRVLGKRLVASALAAVLALTPWASGADVVYIPSEVPLARYTPSAAATVDILNLNRSACLKYRVEFALTLSADDQEVYLRTDSDSGASFDSGGTDYNYVSRGIDTGPTSLSNASTGASSMAIVEDGAGAAVGNTTGESVNGIIRVEHRGSASVDPVISWDTTYASAGSGRTVRMYGGGRRLAQATINALQILAEGATTMTGEVRVYCIRSY